MHWIDSCQWYLPSLHKYLIQDSEDIGTSKAGTIQALLELILHSRGRALTANSQINKLDHFRYWVISTWNTVQQKNGVESVCICESGWGKLCHLRRIMLWMCLSRLSHHHIRKARASVYCLESTERGTTWSCLTQVFHSLSDKIKVVILTATVVMPTLLIILAVMILTIVKYVKVRPHLCH